ncbi:MAG: AmmeMemoRadiSam system radical SAM enzyme [Ignavibacteria bacterium]|nr:AmmeMemoRadiSam system radical SAM enzyme [Ignavibacteria bacterium]
MREALLFQKIDDSKEVLCQLCNHYCKIKPESFGLCRVRMNRDGILYSLTYGKVDGLAIDPIEKKPFFNFKPGTNILSFGTPGCNFKCENCQNNFLSQSIKFKPESLILRQIVPPEEILEVAKKYKVDGLSYTYSEPTIFFEYARDVIIRMKNDPETKDYVHLFVSNGYFSKETFEIIKSEKLLDAINIDLKFFDESHYLSITGGHLKYVLENIEKVFESGIHLEVINLVIPGENDTEESFKSIAKFIISISPEIPLHFNRFYPQYKMSYKPPTSLNSLKIAREIALAEGLHYVYIGNTTLPDVENTYCPKCNFLLVERQNYFTRTHYNKGRKKAVCPKCNTEVNIII